MTDDQPLQRGKIPVLLATPFPNTPEYKPIIDYLRRLQMAEVIDLHMPTPDPAVTYSVQEGLVAQNIPFDQIATAEQLHAQVEPPKNIDDFFTSMADQLAIRDQRAVVLYGSGVDKRSVTLGELFPVTIWSENSRYDNYYFLDKAAALDDEVITSSVVYPVLAKEAIPVLQECILSVYPHAPVLDSGYYRDVSQKIDGLLDRCVNHITNVYQEDRSLSYESILTNKHSDTRPLDINDSLRVEYFRGKVQDKASYSLRKFYSDSALLRDSDSITYWPTDHPDQLCDFFRGAVADIHCEMQLPSPEMMEQRAPELEVLWALHDDIARDVVKVVSAKEAFERIQENWDKHIFGGGDLRDDITQLVTLARDAQLRVDSVHDQFGSFDAAGMSVSDMLHVSSAMFVQRTAAAYLDNVREHYRSEKVLDEVINGIPLQAGVSREWGVHGLPDTELGRLGLNLCRSAQQAQPIELKLIDICDELHGGKVKDLIVQAERHAIYRAGNEHRNSLDLDAPSWDALPASEQARGIDTILARTGYGMTVKDLGPERTGPVSSPVQSSATPDVGR